MDKSHFTSTDVLLTSAEIAGPEELLAQEREFSREAWKILSEMRMRGELPEWVRAKYPHAGTAEQYSEMLRAQESVNQSLLGGEMGTASFWVSQNVDTRQLLVVREDRGLEPFRFEGAAGDLLKQHPEIIAQFTARQLATFANALRGEEDHR